MLPDYERNTYPTPEHFPSKRERCGRLIAYHLYKGGSLLLDVDGVLCRADALEYPEVISQSLISTLQILGTKHVPLGVATARGSQILDYLRNVCGLKMDGQSILEEGQLYIKDGKKSYTVPPVVSHFIKDVRRSFALHPSYTKSWQEIVLRQSASADLLFCSGNTQWQGECRASFWFFADEYTNDEDILYKIFDPILRDLAKRNTIEYETELAISVNRMAVGNLGILSIKGKKDGIPVTKATAADQLDGSWIFAADGFGDTSLAVTTKQVGGAVIGIEGNLDVSEEATEFLENADIVLHNPEEFAFALQHAAVLL